MMIRYSMKSNELISVEWPLGSCKWSVLLLFPLFSDFHVPVKSSYLETGLILETFLSENQI